ncbi:phosphoglucomutase [Clostridium botulinum]|nr:phosphoglucomutase [Clostridium botulinum]
MNITKFNEKFNRVDGKIYVVEELVTPVDGTYEAELIHDNINNLNVYTGSKLTGTKITTYSTSTPSLTPWKTIIKIFSTEPKLYITYETTGDQVEAEDINNLQDAVVETQKDLENYKKNGLIDGGTF